MQNAALAHDLLAPRVSRPSLSLVPAWRMMDENRALGSLRGGGLLLAKGELGYGLLGRSERAIRKMYALAGRPETAPCVFAGDWDVLDEIAVVTPEARAILQRALADAPCAAVFPARRESRLLRGLDPWVRERAVTRGTVTVSMHGGGFFERLVRRAWSEGWCLVGSAEGTATRGGNVRFEDLPERVRRGVDCALDHGAAVEGAGREVPTILDFTDGAVTREGAGVRADAPRPFGRLDA